MRYTIDQAADTVTLTCTVGELYQMQGLDHGVYTTPSTDGKAMQCYLASRPRFRYDFALATVQDFCEAVGWDSLADYEENDPSLADEVTITVPRIRVADEA